MYIAHAVFKSMAGSEKMKTEASEAFEIMQRFFGKFVLNSSPSELGLVVRHFRLKKCYNEEYTRLQYAIAGDVAVPVPGVVEEMTERTLSRLEVEQSIIKLCGVEGAKLKLGTAPQGHLESMAQKLLDKTKSGGSTGKGSKKK